MTDNYLHSRSRRTLRETLGGPHLETGKELLPVFVFELAGDFEIDSDLLKYESPGSATTARACHHIEERA